MDSYTNSLRICPPEHNVTTEGNTRNKAHPRPLLSAQADVMGKKLLLANLLNYQFLLHEAWSRNRKGGIGSNGKQLG